MLHRKVHASGLGALASIAITCGGLVAVGAGTAQAAGCPTVSDATLVYITSGGITGAPSALPSGYQLLRGYLVGPGSQLRNADLSGLDLAQLNLNSVVLTDANLSGTNLTGTDLQYSALVGENFQGADLARVSASYDDFSDADLTGANVSDADLHDANFTGLTLTGANFTGANLRGVYETAPSTGTPKAMPADFPLVDGFVIGPGVEIRGTSLKGADLSKTDLTGAEVLSTDLTSASLNGANLTNADLSGDTVTDMTTVGATWLNTICPDNSNSNAHVHGCLTPLDTTPPTVTLSGVVSGHVYVLGAVSAHCTTTDNGTVAHPAALSVRTTWTNGAGRATATCSGAVDLAGNRQAAPVSVSYTAIYGMTGFLVPAKGSSIAKSAHTITVRFRLTSTTGKAVATWASKGLAASHDVRVTLQGPGIKAVTVNCGWNASQQYLTCAIRIPSGVRTGTSQRYTLTATENVGTGFLTVPGVHGGADPEVIHFR